MKRFLFAAFVIACAAAADAQVQARGFVAFEQYHLGLVETSGFRQSYDIGVHRALTSTMSVRMQLRADDFRGTSEIATGRQSSNLTNLQPTAQFTIAAETLQVSVISDFFDSRTTVDDLSTNRGMERSIAQLTWSPLASFVTSLRAQRMVTDDSATGIDVSDEWASGGLTWSWRGLRVAGTERYSRTDDGFLDRQSLSHNGMVEYTASAFNDRLSISASAATTINEVKEKSVSESDAVAIPVVISRALFGVDDTPADTRDHPLAPYPGLTDGFLEASVGISIGPNSVSFQNIAVDIGRIAPVDELRIHARDASGNPLRNGGGPVTWDIWTSTDGVIWVQVPGATSSFNRVLSRYEVRFPELVTRWVKAVNFGVNIDATNITEIQAYHREVLDARVARNGMDQNLNSSAMIQVRPVSGLLLSYVGLYNGYERDYDEVEPSRSTYVEHAGAVEYQVLRTLVARADFTMNETDTGREFAVPETSEAITGSLRYSPTRRLHFIGEVSQQRQVFGGATVDTDGTRLRFDATVFPSLMISGGVGRQIQTSYGGTATRTYADLTTSARLTRTLRMNVTGSIQEVESEGSDFAQLLGATRDNRVTTELTWRPGDPLLLSARVGWVSGGVVSGFTHRVRAEWYPFAGGTLLLGGSYDQDIDPMIDRKATRVVFNPRLLINRWAAFDVNYTSVTTRLVTSSVRQRSLLATLIFTR